MLAIMSKCYTHTQTLTHTHWMANCNGRCREKNVKLKLRHVYYAIGKLENMDMRNCNVIALNSFYQFNRVSHSLKHNNSNLLDNV